MDIKTTLPISEARRRIFELAEEVQKPNKHYTLTEKGRPKAVLMSAEEFESWEETLNVMKEFPNLKQDIKKTDLAVKSGEYKKWSNLDDVMTKYGYVMVGKDKNTYGVGNKIREKSNKKP